MSPLRDNTHHRLNVIANLKNTAYLSNSQLRLAARRCGALKTKREKSEYEITMIVAAIIFIILGILIKYGKMYWLIAGYNTMPKEEKEKYNIKGIANLFGNVMFGMALIIISGYLIAKSTENPNIQNYSFWASMIIGIPYLLVKSNSKKYKIKN